MAKLNQVIATGEGVKTRAQAGLTQIHHLLEKPSLLAGMTKTYQPRADDDLPPPPEAQRVQISAEGAILDMRALMSELFDVTAQREWANAGAKADVVVDGTTLVKDAPVTFLLFLEKKLNDLHTFVKKLPLLDPSEEWKRDTNTNLWMTEPTMTVRTKKLPRVLSKAAATKEHAEQTEVWYEDVPVGQYVQVKYSGAMEATRVKELTRRVEALMAAVKYAREEANAIEAPVHPVAGPVFDYLLAP